MGRKMVITKKHKGVNDHNPRAHNTMEESTFIKDVTDKHTQNESKWSIVCGP
jgi:hypothetical protein